MKNLNIRYLPESIKTADFSGKTLSHLANRSRALGIGIAHGRVLEVQRYYAQRAYEQEMEGMYGVVAASLHALIKTKRGEIRKIVADVQNGFVDSLEDKKELLVQVMKIEQEIKELDQQLGKVIGGN